MIPESGETIEDHKWIVEEEISYDGKVSLGDKVIIHAMHMSGMNGAVGTIDQIAHVPVYMVDYESTENGHWVKNHQWVIESEIKQWEEKN